MKCILCATSLAACVVAVASLGCDRATHGTSVAQYTADAGYGVPNPMPGSPIADAGVAPIGPAPKTPPPVAPPSNPPINPGSPNNPSAPPVPGTPAPSPSTP